MDLNLKSPEVVPLLRLHWKDSFDICAPPGALPRVRKPEKRLIFERTCALERGFFRL